LRVPSRILVERVRLSCCNHTLVPVLTRGASTTGRGHPVRLPHLLRLLPFSYCRGNARSSPLFSTKHNLRTTDMDEHYDVVRSRPRRPTICLHQSD
jgi:hypothetical protein